MSPSATKAPLQSGDVAPPGVYRSIGHAGQPSCGANPRQIEIGARPAELPRCRCGGILVWAPGAGS